MYKPILSLVTGTRNRPADFRRLVDSIDHNTPMPWELIVSDASDAPIDNEAVATAETWPRITVIPERPRLGCTAGYNKAFREAKGKWVIWLNDDSEVQPGYALAAIRFMEANPAIGLGAIDYAERERPYAVNAYLGMTYANFGIISNDLGSSLGWFDEEFPMYGNDNSLSFKVLMAGKGIARVPEAKIFHYCRHDVHRRENDDQEQRRRDSDLLMRKYGPHVPVMREVYERCGGQLNPVREQAPNWMLEQVNK